MATPCLIIFRASHARRARVLIARRARVLTARRARVLWLARNDQARGGRNGHFGGAGNLYSPGRVLSKHGVWWHSSAERAARAARAARAVTFVQLRRAQLALP